MVSLRKLKSTGMSVRGVVRLAVVGVTMGWGLAAGAQSALPLLQKSDLVYEGAFQTPSGGSDQNTFSWGGTALFYHPGNNSLFMTGHAHHQRTAEISVPAPGTASTIGGLPRATFIQSFADATEGRLRNVNPSDSNDKHVGGHMVYNGKLYVSGFATYDAGGTQDRSHFVRPISLSTTGQVQGPFRVGSDAHFTSGYMALVPDEWQAALGGPALAGNCCLSITSVQSNGPSVSVFTPDGLATGNVAATMLVGYPYPRILGPGETTQNQSFNLTTKIKGVVFPAGSRSVLFFGRHGTGPYCYGDGSECGDPTNDYKGGHAYPYKYQVWAYDANDLVAVKQGTKAAHTVLPYAIWNFNLPFEADDDHAIGGAAYDPSTGRIFVSQMNHTGGNFPIIHTFRVTASSMPRPTSPGNFQVQ